MDTSKLNRKPIHLSDDVWYYEEKEGLYLYYGKNGNAGERVCIIPWRKLRHSVKRYEEAKDGKSK